MNPFPDKLHFDNAGMIGGRRHIITTKAFPVITSLGRFDVPAATLSDGGTIPPVGWSVIGHPFDYLLEECVVHDHLYSKANTEFTRAEADLILRELLWNRGIPAWKIAIVYAAVRAFGWRYFKGGPQ